MNGGHLSQSGSMIETRVGVNTGGLCLEWIDDLDGSNDRGGTDIASIYWALVLLCPCVPQRPQNQISSLTVGSYREGGVLVHGGFCF
jgi:hypothetical protein